MGAFVDSKGNPLDGGKNYKLHLPPNIPVANFWSVILYDNQTRSMLQNDQQWPAVSSQTKGLMVNPDSSVDVYFGPNPPAGKEMNWVHIADLAAGREIAGKYQVTYIPSTFIINRQGKIEASQLRGNELKDKIAELLK